MMERYEVRDIDSTFVGVWDYGKAAFVNTVGGQLYAVSDVSRAAWVAKQLNYNAQKGK